MNGPDLTQKFFPGQIVLVIAPRSHAYSGRHGKVIDSYLMISAAGIQRRKYTIEFFHSRTKTRTVRLAMELEELQVIE